MQLSTDLYIFDLLSPFTSISLPLFLLFSLLLPLLRLPSPLCLPLCFLLQLIQKLLLLFDQLQLPWSEHLSGKEDLLDTVCIQWSNDVGEERKVYMS